MLFVVLLVLIGSIGLLVRDHAIDMRDAEIMDELYRLEYHHVYPTGN